MPPSVDAYGCPSLEPGLQAMLILEGMDGPRVLGADPLSGSTLRTSTAIGGGSGGTTSNTGNQQWEGLFMLLPSSDTSGLMVSGPLLKLKDSLSDQNGHRVPPEALPGCWCQPRPPPSRAPATGAAPAPPRPLQPVRGSELLRWLGCWGFDGEPVRGLVGFSTGRSDGSRKSRCQP